MLCSVCSTCYQIIISFQLVIKLSVIFLWHMLCSDGSAGQSNATYRSAGQLGTVPPKERMLQAMRRAAEVLRRLDRGNTGHTKHVAVYERLKAYLMAWITFHRNYNGIFTISRIAMVYFQTRRITMAAFELTQIKKIPIPAPPRLREP